MATETATKPTATPKRKRGNPIDPNESKRQRFARVCTPRVRKVLQNIELVGTCFNSPQYEAIQSDFDAFAEAVREALETASPRGKREQKTGFQF
jgi:hypothetical protein